MEFLGLFVYLAGLIIGLGAVTVIDLHGFLGRKSSYWTMATIRTHKVTKPLIWIGTFLALIGFFIYFSKLGFGDLQWIQFGIFVLLILNGSWLSFWLSPKLLEREQKGKAEEILPDRWQRFIILSFLISFSGWWSQVALLAYVLVA